MSVPHQVPSLFCSPITPRKMPTRFPGMPTGWRRGNQLRTALSPRKRVSAGVDARAHKHTHTPRGSDTPAGLALLPYPARRGGLKSRRQKCSHPRQRRPRWGPQQSAQHLRGAGRAGGGGGPEVGAAAGMARWRAPGKQDSAAVLRGGGSTAEQAREGGARPSSHEPAPALSPPSLPLPAPHRAAPATTTRNVSGGAGLSNRAPPQPSSAHWPRWAPRLGPWRPGGARL